MDDVVLVAVEVPLIGDERHKNWAKVVTNVDGSRRSGWAFEGDFVATGGVQDVPAGSVLLVYGERGLEGQPADRGEGLPRQLGRDPHSRGGCQGAGVGSHPP